MLVELLMQNTVQTHITYTGDGLMMYETCWKSLENTTLHFHIIKNNVLLICDNHFDSRYSNCIFTAKMTSWILSNTSND